MQGNYDRALPGWPPVVVAGGYLTGIVLMRNLSRRGVSVCCIDFISTQPVFQTVYGKAHLCPNPDTHGAEWVKFMIALAGNLKGKPVLIPSADQFVTAIGDHAAELEPHFTFCRSSAETQALLATKKRQYDIAGKHGLPVPRTEFVTSLEDLQRFSAAAQFPCLLKPTHFREWERVPKDHPLYGQKVAIASSPEELDAKYKLASEASPQLVVQEIIEGPDTAKLVYLSCYASSGERIGSCIVRQLRTWPIYFGSASVVEPVTDPETDGLCDAFLRSIGYIGLCEIELKRDQRDGRVKMIEANPRYSVTADAASYAGVDLGWLHYLDLTGQKVTPVLPSPRDFRHIFLLRDFATFRDYQRAGLLTWRQLIHSYRQPRAFFDFDVHDWRVTASTVNQLARTLLVPWMRKILPKR
jgi:D-aspartate ligase